MDSMLTSSFFVFMNGDHSSNGVVSVQYFFNVYYYGYVGDGDDDGEAIKASFKMQWP